MTVSFLRAHSCPAPCTASALGGGVPRLCFPGLALPVLLSFSQFSGEDTGSIFHALLVGPFCWEQFEARREKNHCHLFL